MEPQASGVKTWQWVVTIIVIIAIIVIGILVSGSKKSETPVVTEPVVTTEPTTVAALNRIVMVDQYPGNIVYLSSVQVEKSAWVVIHANNAGQPGEIIGSVHFAAGLTAGTKITLTKPTVDGGTYYAVIYTSDGAAKFNAKTDLPLKDAKGNVIMKIFHASAAAEVNLKG